MQALTFRGTRTIRHEAVPEPNLEYPGDAVVRVEWAGLCGSDLHVWHGREQGIDPGTVMGHELVGTVVEVGPGVHRLEVGDRVVSPFTTSCGTCAPCEETLTARCIRGQLYGWVEGGLGLQGAQAEFVRVPLADGTLVKVPENLPMDLALLAADVLPTGAFGTALAGLEDLEEGREAPVNFVVIGCGAVGLSAILAARRLEPAKRIWALDPVSDRLELAERLGATPCLPNNTTVDTIRRATDGRGAAHVLDAVGRPTAARLAYDLLRAGGTLGIVGVHTEPHLPFSPVELYDKNVTLRTGRCSARSRLPETLELLSQGELDPTPLLTHRFPLEDGPAVYAAFAERREGIVKAVFQLS